MRKKTTLAQVAVVAGVSKTTASYVLNGDRKMSAETAAKVLKAAKELGYRLDSRASGLRRGGGRVIGILSTGLEVELAEGFASQYWPKLTAAFIQRCSADGVVAAFVGRDQAQALLDSGIDMLLVFGPQGEEIFTGLKLPFGLPLMSLQPIKGYDTVILRHDHDKIAEAVVGHFKEQGATRMGWVTLNQTQSLLSHWTDALSRACAAKGLSMKAYLSDGSHENIQKSLSQAVDDGVDAIFSLTGNTKLVRDAIQATGKSIPDDVLLVVQAEGVVEESMDPSVSTLSLDAEGSATVTERVALEVIQGIPHEIEDFPFELVVRESSKRR